MANTPSIQDDQGRVLAGMSAHSISVKADQGYTLGAIGFPTHSLPVDQAVTLAALREENPIHVSQAFTLAAARGRVTNFHMRAWTFSMDGHDFYVITLGEYGTLVYDTTTGQWVDWESPNRDVVTWRAQCGLNWYSPTNTAYNSEVVAGDDLTGMLWYLDPDQAYDGGDSIGSSLDAVNKFTRTLIGGIPARGRGNTSTNFVFMTGSLGNPVMGSQVLLRTSDDLGKNWVDNGYITVTTDPTQDITWYSLGSFGAPGRIFELSDDGAFARVDTLETD